MGILWSLLWTMFSTFIHPKYSEEAPLHTHFLHVALYLTALVSLLLSFLPFLMSVYMGLYILAGEKMTLVDSIYIGLLLPMPQVITCTES